VAVGAAAVTVVSGAVALAMVGVIELGFVGGMPVTVGFGVVGLPVGTVVGVSVPVGGGGG
jgi:hypothetical protein